jgi:hypothetical protein
MILNVTYRVHYDNPKIVDFGILIKVSDDYSTMDLGERELIINAAVLFDRARRRTPCRHRYTILAVVQSRRAIHASEIHDTISYDPPSTLGVNEHVEGEPV